MKEYTMSELYRLTRAELLRLAHEMTMELFRLPMLCDDHTIAFINQRRICRELARREPIRGLGRWPTSQWRPLWRTDFTTKPP